MTTTNQITPGMTLDMDGKIYRVESSVKVSVPKGSPIIKAKLRDLLTDQMIEKNFKLNQPIVEISLEEHQLEFLYPEKKSFLFLDIANLEQILVPGDILGDKINYLKEGIAVKAVLYKDKIFSLELPQFLELMVIKTESTEEAMAVSSSTKKATLETGANVDVPLFIETGDVIKVDTQSNEYIQRV
ncbi:MAG: elongation factor P [Chlamydiae bacterium CG10_big_fil_rev_8_21_14_0_10_35_9]|nr:MAG: elongation factor P [Chlamydiae bacterium CG10_big_fil_rev_8_21_14_0_10_35_9]